MKLLKLRRSLFEGTPLRQLHKDAKTAKAKTQKDSCEFKRTWKYSRVTSTFTTCLIVEWAHGENKLEIKTMSGLWWVMLCYIALVGSSIARNLFGRTEKYTEKDKYVWLLEERQLEWINGEERERRLYGKHEYNDMKKLNNLIREVREGKRNELFGGLEENVWHNGDRTGKTEEGLNQRNATVH